VGIREEGIGGCGCTRAGLAASGHHARATPKPAAHIWPHESRKVSACPLPHFVSDPPPPRLPLAAGISVKCRSTA
jgi:hypothetical protein